MDVLRPDLAPPRLLPERLLVACAFFAAGLFDRFGAPAVDFLAPAFLEPLEAFEAFEPLDVFELDLGVFELDLEPERFPAFLDVMCPP